MVQGREVGEVVPFPGEVEGDWNGARRGGPMRFCSLGVAALG